MTDIAERQAANESIKSRLAEVSRAMHSIEIQLYDEPGSSAEMARAFERAKAALDSFSSATYFVSQNLSDEFQSRNNPKK